VNLSLQVMPNVEDNRLYEVVDKAIEVIKSSGVKYLVGPMETTMEGELDELFAIAKKAILACNKEGARRIGAVIKVDYCENGVTIEEKIGKYTEKQS
ncbi:MAG: hypothetical protein PWP21_1353, partial [Thermosediminibacterales bacterium]|nr:hypothetical protein [Thermosediminibacterales bacterium]